MENCRVLLVLSSMDTFRLEAGEFDSQMNTSFIVVPSLSHLYMDTGFLLSCEGWSYLPGQILHT